MRQLCIAKSSSGATHARTEKRRRNRSPPPRFHARRGRASRTALLRYRTRRTRAPRGAALDRFFDQGSIERLDGVDVDHGGVDARGTRRRPPPRRRPPAGSRPCWAASTSREPVAASTHGSMTWSGWPWRRLPSLRSVSSSASGSSPASASAAYTMGTPWPFEMTKRSRSAQLGSPARRRSVWKKQGRHDLCRRQRPARMTRAGGGDHAFRRPTRSAPGPSRARRRPRRDHRTSRSR
jgi:hypothetical protein